MNKSKWIFKITFVLILLVSSIGIYLSYPSKETVMSKGVDEQGYDNIFNTIEESSVTLIDQLALKSGNNYYENSLKIIEESKSMFPGITAENWDYVKRMELDSLRSDSEWRMERLSRETELKYYAEDIQSGIKISNKESLANSNYKEEIGENKKYRWYVEVIYDEQGKATYNTSLSNQVSFDNYFDNSRRSIDEIENQIYNYLSDLYGYKDATDVVYNQTRDAIDNRSTDVVSLENPKQIKLVYLIPNDISWGSMLMDGGNPFEISVIYILPYIFMALLIITLFMLFYPIRIVKECNPFKTLIRVKAEVIAFAIGILPFTFGAFGVTVLSSVTIAGMFKAALKEINFIYGADLFVFISNVAAWMFVLFSVAFIIFWIKYIFHIGFIKYLKDYTIFNWCIRKIKIFINKALAIDFNDEANKIIFKIVIVNFIIVLALNFVFEFSFLFLIIYSILLFAILKNKFQEVKKDYNVLLKETKKLSNGDFDVNTKVNVGMLNPLRDELGNIKEGFEKAVKEEVKSQRMKTELVSNVSHDLKTPLTSIITYVDLLKNKDVSDQERSEYLDTIDRNSLRLKNLIDDLFEVSKVNSGNVKLDFIDIDIVSLLQQAIFECSDNFKSAGLELKSSYDKDKIICSLDSSKTYRIFENLIMNIYKYAMPNTRVYIDVKENDTQVNIIFRNISANEITFNEVEIVERFVQGDKSRNTRGSGLGLAIAKSFTELQNGEFNIETDGDLFKAIVKFDKL